MPQPHNNARALTRIAFVQLLNATAVSSARRHAGKSYLANKKKLDRWIAQGLPLNQDGRHIDLVEASAWLAEQIEIAEAARAHKFADAPRPGIVAGTNGVAQAFGVSARTVNKWRKVGMPEHDADRHLFDIVAIARWDADRDRKSADAGDPDRRYSEARARLREMEVAEREGNLISRTDIYRTWSQLIVDARRRLLALPRSLARRFAGKSELRIERDLDHAIRSVLYDLAGEEHRPLVDAPPAPKPAAKKKRRAKKKRK